MQDPRSWNKNGDLDLKPLLNNNRGLALSGKILNTIVLL
jgi:hypothetical protein